MKTSNDYPKEINRITDILGYAEEREMDETHDDENSSDEEEEVKKYEDEDSRHYSVGGDNGL